MVRDVRGVSWRWLVCTRSRVFRSSMTCNLPTKTAAVATESIPWAPYSIQLLTNMWRQTAWVRWNMQSETFHCFNCE